MPAPPDPAFARRHRRRRLTSLAIIISLTLLAISIIADHTLVASPFDPANLDRQSVTVLAAPTGDTLLISTPAGQTQTIRLLGIAAPLPHAPAADAARAYLADRAVNHTVTLSFEPLAAAPAAYVYLTPNDLLNVNLVRGGYAYADRRISCTFSPQFQQAESQARKKSRGLWPVTPFNQQPQWRQDWLKSFHPH